MSLRVLIAAALALCTGLGSLYAQTGTSPAKVTLPWFDYRPERIGNDFESIIGRSGTNSISWLANQVWSQSAYDRTVALPFSFTFLRTTYPAGTLIGIGQDGWITFNGSTQSYSWGSYTPNLDYNTGNTYGHWNKYIAPYNSDLATTGVSNPAGGVYWRVDGTAPNRVMTIEWRVTGGYYPAGPPGGFQMKMFEDKSAIEFHYDEDGRIPRTKPTDNPLYTLGYGALVGLKNYGQAYTGQEPTETSFNNDEDNFMIFVHPDEVTDGRQPGEGEDTIAITRVNTINLYGSNPFYTVSYSYYESYATTVYVYYKASPWWHYRFPTEDGDPIGYRAVPILNDVACDSVWFSPDNGDGIDAFNANAPVTVSARFQNRAGAVKNNIPVRFDVYYNSNSAARVYSSEQLTVSPGGRLGRASATFNAIPGTNHVITGLYQVRAYPRDPAEEDFKNDTCKKAYFIIGINDIATYQILSPFQNVSPLFTKYPVGVGVPIEVRYLNIGIQDQENVPVGYTISNDAGVLLHEEKDVIIPGTFRSVTFRDINLPSWAPSVPGQYFLRVFSDLSNDEQRNNDTIPTQKNGYSFASAYEIELEARFASLSPFPNQGYPVGKPILVEASFANNGITDATNSPATITITGPGSSGIVYNQTVQVSEIVAGGNTTIQRFPDFVPSQASGPGRYTVTVTINNPQDPITSNNTLTWTFFVRPQIRGEILVGFGERFQTIQEARDSLYYLGVSGPVDLILVDDSYAVAPGNNDASLPAVDFRGTIVGAGPSAPITWRPHPNKTSVTINLMSPSGIGMWFGQQDTANPNGYMTFDGGAEKKLHFVLDHTGNMSAEAISVPFLFGRGSSNFAVKNCVIEAVDALPCVKTLTMPSYDPGFNRFTYLNDIEQDVSAGIMLRNIMPGNGTGQNPSNADTLYNQNNVFEGNVIRGFAYGIASVGAGPIFRVQNARFDEINNRNNVYRGNTIENVTRAGIVLAYESNSQIVGNTIAGVSNLCATSPETGAAGIWINAGNNGRGYSSNLEIARNQISNVRANAGTVGGILVENNRNVLVTPANVVQEFPSSSNVAVANNMVWNYAGGSLVSGIGVGVAASAGTNYTPRGNTVQNNTVYNTNTNTAVEYGIGVQGAEAVVQNNIVAVLNTNAVGLGYEARAAQNDLRTTSVTSDYNLIWAPNGYVGAMSRVSSEGFTLPSPPVAKTLSQWRYLTGLDENSLVGNIVPEFMSTSVGSEDLHLNPQQTQSLAGNRGTQIAGLTTDLDNDPRTQAAVNGRYDLGADEFWGVTRNNDILAEDVLSPFGYRATTGSFSDAEYVMTDSAVALEVRVRNLGGRPVANAAVTMDVQYWTGSSWVNELSASRLAPVDLTEASVIDFGNFNPKTMRELGMSNATFGTMAPNVTPLYRFVVTTGNDDNLSNNRYEKVVRFYVQRSKTEAMVSVENYAPVGTSLPTNVVELGNRLNSDSILAAMSQIGWDRTGTTGGNADFNYDLLERDRWPQYALNFAPWQLMMWMQGEDAEGLNAEERQALKDQQNAWTQWRPAGLFITGQEVARKHDVALNALNGNVADRDFVRNYLRGEYRGNTNPASYENLRVQGIRITHGRFETVKSTGVSTDAGPMPSVLRATSGDGVAQGTHWYVDHNAGSTGGDTVSGMTVATQTRASVYYAIDIRHFGRFAPEADRSGVQRVVLGAIDFLNQYGTVLPVDLTSMAARQTGREAVTVTWVTASEKDIASLELQRAEVLKTETGEQIGSFQAIAERAPEGGVSKEASYRVVDEGVRMGREYVYRLVSVEKDGNRLTIADQRVLVVGGTNGAYALEVRPNPVVTRGEVSWRAPRGEEVVVRVVNNVGQEVMTSSLVSTGEGVLAINVRDLSSGQYFVELRTSGGTVVGTVLHIQK